ncbi:unnamed protein product [Paramecium pentaurelia]|uniref:Transmembrane protein n=1 Tax=Paramecium pentaurelia TaxID=43138 RepID=A0A8S1TNM0_9CILI|nr:unnamed protein product [Paramecium pentaurelia]
MNKYSLIFLDKESERKYQEQKINQLRKPVYICSAIGLFFISMIKMITQILDNQQNELSIIIVTQIYLILSIFIIKWKPQLVQSCLIILNYLLLAYQYMLTNTISQEALQLFANNFVACNFVIILTVDMCQGIILVTTTMLIRMSLAISEATTPQYNVYFATILLICFLSFFIHKLNYESRSYFLLSLKDNLMEQILPIIVNKSYILFQFENNQLRFSLISSRQLEFNCDNSENLKSFLREWNYKQQNLEQFCFQDIKRKQSQEIKSYSKQIEIKKGSKQTQKITICFFSYQQPTFLIKFDNNSQIQDKLKNYLFKSIEKERLVQFKIFKCIVNNLSISLRSSNLQQLHLLRIYCFKQILNYKILNHQFKQQDFEINPILQKLKDFFQFKQVNYQIIPSSDGKVQMVKTYFLRLIYDIFNECKEDSTIVINLEHRLEPYIRYYGREINEYTDTVIQTVVKTLVKKQQMMKIGNQTTILILLNEEPNYPFQSSLQI